MAFANLNLVFHGIDTVSQIYLNGKQILETDNMFTRYNVDVHGILQTENEMVVNITSPVFYALTQFTDYYNNNYTVYPTSHPSAQHGVEHANFVRKMQVFDFRRSIELAFTAERIQVVQKEAHRVFSRFKIPELVQLGLGTGFSLVGNLEGRGD